MTDEIDTSNEAVGRLVFASVTASPTHLSTMSDTLCALAVERDALRQRAEKAEASDAESIAMYQQARRRAEKERARAEKAEGALRELVAECTCHPAYSGRGMQDPECPAGLFGDISREGLGLPPRCQHDRAALRQDEGGEE